MSWAQAKSSTNVLWTVKPRTRLSVPLEKDALAGRTTAEGQKHVLAVFFSKDPRSCPMCTEILGLLLQKQHSSVGWSLCWSSSVCWTCPLLGAQWYVGAFISSCRIISITHFSCSCPGGGRNHFFPPRSFFNRVSGPHWGYKIHINMFTYRNNFIQV